MINRLIRLLEQLELDMSAEDIADALWLANQIKLPSVVAPVDEVTQSNQSSQTTAKIPLNLREPSTSTKSENLGSSTEEKTKAPTAKAYTKDDIDSNSSSNSIEKPTPEKPTPSSSGVPFKAPAVAALPNALEIGRSLRPLMRKVPSRIKFVLDEENTVQQIAENDVWIPVLKPARERWLDLVLVVEENRATVVWEETINEFRKLMERHGAFRNVYTWSLRTNDGKPQFFHQQGKTTKKQRSRSPKELLEPNGRRLILLISDCVSSLWWQGEIHQLLELWSKQVPVTVLQLLPEQLWERTVLDLGISVSLSAIEPGLLNSQLTVHDFPMWLEENPNQALKLPIVILEPESLKYWAKVMAGTGTMDTVGIVFMPNWKELIPTDKLSSSQTIEEPELLVNKLVNTFYHSASPLARKLAIYMASAPVSMPVIHLIQEKMLPQPRKPIILAEIFMSGLLELRLVSEENQPEIWRYEFVKGVREVLLRSIRKTEVDAVFETVSQYIAQKAGIQIKNFQALLFANSDWDENTTAEILPFAEITKEVLQNLGGDYARLAQQLEPVGVIHELPLPEIKTFEFECATVTIKDDVLQPFTFTFAKIELIKKSQSFGLTQKTELSVNKYQKQAQQFTEDLGNGIKLEMVAIPGGTFIMGSPETEDKSTNDERPQHEVTIKPFSMGKYPITQAQWQAVAQLPQVNQELKPDPSRFKGANRPVEQVSWHDVVEFCARLSNYTKRPYRLPSEAEWEYACRAGTTTPFHFGETITTDLANYDGNYTYGNGVKGVYRGETTEVGSFQVANEFGLYDMHGNVWEWCEDDWHNNYENAPADGSAWISGESNNNKKVLRGGSWHYNPEYCRSARRGSYVAGFDLDHFGGFRVVCGAAWTL
ncbi:formylglycine-generating enzyme family protein [Sphaerospermopsis sp. FACHB-1194]|uniref:formylglycine-generating enzyme family protein n=1 Tax=Sphaerospermopsis sp. FACHB-1194 TaxID=2692862 RepID=UPI0016816724|nr:formylglycine-generating enzyme family protein [Sphaerospermopsis sp. FACHB-1194]MBD2143800.1 formylglycine-generating enzyme family protein [Sphaerospermopsis sp. FACHB-1194]